MLTRRAFWPAGGEGDGDLILENSLSMAYREDGGERYDLARKAVKEVIESSNGQVAILPTASFPASRFRQERQIRWMTREEALKELILHSPLLWKR